MDPNRQVLQYICLNCNNLLIKTHKTIDWKIITSCEECPKCGSLLSSKTVMTATQQDSIQKVQTTPFWPKFQTASRLCFDIEKIDSVLNLGAGDRVCVAGEHSKTLVERLLISSLLPESYGGFGSANVIIIDAGNCSDVYQTVNFARQYGLDIPNILRRVIVSRPFTVYQLANLVISELPLVMQKFDAKIIIVTDMLHMFLDDPQVKIREAKHLLNSAMYAIRQISFNTSSIAIISFHYNLPSEYSPLLFPNFNKYIQTIAGNSDRIMVKVNSRKEDCKIIQLQQEELELIPQK